MPGGHDADNSTNWAIQARTRLALRRAEKPATKAGQIRALWPDIEAALAVGQNVKSICRWLEDDAGITLGVTSLTSYISRIRRNEAANRSSGATVKQCVHADTKSTLGFQPARTSKPIPVTDHLREVLGTNGLVDQTVICKELFKVVSNGTSDESLDGIKWRHR